jgi:hypothetical protein
MVSIKVRAVSQNIAVWRVYVLAEHAAPFQRVLSPVAALNVLHSVVLPCV